MKTSREKKSPVQALSALHESASLRAVTGPSLRPGGFLLTERGLSLGGFSPGARILDVGCGTGASVEYLRRKHRFRALGIDMSGGLFREGVDADSIPLAVGRAEALPFSDCCCDGVLCECVLSLVKEPKQAVGEILRVLSSGGILILGDVYDRLPGSGLSSGLSASGGCPSMLQSRAFIERLLGDSGFELLVWEDHTRYLKELVAQLILNSDSQAEIHELCSVFDPGCPGISAFRSVSPGYFLLVARKMTKGESFHG